jgi:PEP-CTERM motif
MKIINSPSLGAFVYFEGGGFGWNFIIANDQVRYLDSAGNFLTLALFDTTDAFHQYKVVIPANSANFDLLIDNNLVASASANTRGGNLLQFGDPTSTGGNGIADWDYVRLINSPTTNPAPEPATLALLLVGFGLLNLRRKQ